MSWPRKARGRAMQAKRESRGVPTLSPDDDVVAEAENLPVEAPVDDEPEDAPAAPAPRPPPTHRTIDCPSLWRRTPRHLLGRK